MRAVVTVTGYDKRGIIAAVSAFLAERDINIEDISQTILGGCFAMIMIVGLPEGAEIATVAKDCEKMGRDIGMSVRFQHEDIFNAMHTV